MIEPVNQRPAWIPEEPGFLNVEERVATEKRRESHFIQHYDRAVFDWIGKVVGIEGIPIRRIKSTPMRAFADYKCLLQQEDPKLAESLKDASSLLQFPLPLAVISPPTRKWRREWGNSKAPIRNIRFIPGSGKRRTTYMRPPRPFDLTYQIEFYSRMEIHRRWIVEQIESQFWPMAYAKIESPYQSLQESGDFRYMPIKYGDFVDNSDLEPGSEGDRLLRDTLTITVEGFQWFDEMGAPTLHRILTEDYEGNVSRTDLNNESPETATEVMAEIPSGPATDGVVEL